MKAVLAVLALLSAGTFIAGPAMAFDRPAYASDVRDRGGWEGEPGWDRGGWRRDRWEERDDALSEG